jgi:hypothetical protein
MSGATVSRPIAGIYYVVDGSESASIGLFELTVPGLQRPSAT